MHFFILVPLKYAKALRNIKQLNICTFLQIFKNPSQIESFGSKKRACAG